MRYNVQDNTPTFVCEQRVISEATVAREWTIAKAWLRANLSDPLAFPSLAGRLSPERALLPNADTGVTMSDPEVDRAWTQRTVVASVDRDRQRVAS